MTKKSDNWMQTLWRPAMGWMYMLICLLDMAVFPVLWALWQGVNHVPITQWNPLTLQGAGLFHIAMGAVLGISAFGRTQEKLAGTAANPTATEQISVNTTNTSGVPAGGFGSNPSFGSSTPGGFGTSAPASSGFGSTPLGGNSASSFGGGFGSSTPATSGFGSSTPATSGFGSSTPATTSFPALSPSAPPAAPVTGQVAQSANGKLKPVPAQDPEL